MKRFWPIFLGVFVLGAGMFFGLSLMTEESGRDTSSSVPPVVVEEPAAEERVAREESEKPRGRWTGPPDEHPAARLRKNRMERGRLGIPPRKRGAEASRRRPLWEQEFARTALVRAGYAPSEIDRLEARYEAARDQALQELRLGPYAAGGGGAGFAEEQRAQDALSDLVADVNDYDALLFATGQPNRVEVKDVMPLGRAHGLQPGDQFWEYNGQRIFPHDGYLSQMRADQATGLVQPVIIYRPDQGFFPIYMKPEKQGWGVTTRPVSRVPGQEADSAGD